MRSEPLPLRRGKAFHKLIQAEWEREAQGKVTSEEPVTKPTGRRGRVDVFIDDDDPKAPIAVIEIKATDWERIKPQNVRRNVKRQIRQIYSYVESQILEGEYVKGGKGKDVCPGIIFPKRPLDQALLEMIEELFFKACIQVVWHDETMEECKSRNMI
jgi:hypothetical protein